MLSFVTKKISFEIRLSKKTLYNCKDKKSFNSLSNSSL